MSGISIPSRALEGAEHIQPPHSFFERVRVSVPVYSQRLKMYQVVEVAGVDVEKGIVGNISVTRDRCSLSF